MEKETWKDIPGYEGKYQASTMGRIRSLNRLVEYKCPNRKTYTRMMKGRILRPGRFCKSGHVSVVLGHGAAGSPVHQLVARTFLGPCPLGKEVLHNNGIPTDNRLSNLRYDTRTENIFDVYRQGGIWRKLSVDDVAEIKFALYCGFSGADLARQFNVCESTISAIKNGRTFQWV